MSFFQIFNKLLFLLNSQERKRAGLLLVMTIITALLEMIGVASILPFMAVLTNTNLIESNIILRTAFDYLGNFGVENSQQFLFVLGVTVFILLIISLSCKALTTYAQLRFIQMREYSISKRLVEGYLYQPYSWFLSRNSADLGKTILSEVNQIINNGIRPFMEIIAKGLASIALLTLLIIADPKLAIIVGLFLTITYGAIFYLLRKYLNHIGKERLKSNEHRFTTISEAFGASKEVKVAGLEKNYINIFSNSAQSFARSTSLAQIISQLPRFALEAVAFGGVLLIILYIMTQSGSFVNALPIVSLYVFAGYRLMPSLQQIYTSFTELTFIGPSLNKLHEDLKSLKKFEKHQDQKAVSLKHSISLKNIDYSYPNSSRQSLKNINCDIPAKSIIGFVGPTGSGKTTTIDIILGLLEPQKGTLEVDGNVIDAKNVRSWQSLIGYVPQNIFLSDDTIESNIAFGINTKHVDKFRLQHAAKIANIHQFIIDELPKQYQTFVGERGVRLSGGQRQRIGIARALYNNPQVLILDEATSSLDNQTEQAVMDAVNNLGNNITIILIAHRLNTVKNCHKIYKLNKGTVISQGKLDELN